MKAMILAAGKGTRMNSLTETAPKPMLLVAGKPVLAHIIEWLWRHGIHQVAINLHYHPEVIREYFDDGSRWGVEIIYSEEPELLGTAGGVKKMEAFFGDPFLVVYGDVLTDLDLGALLDFHQFHCGSPHATLTLDKREDSAQCGVAEIDRNGRIQDFIEKPPPGGSRSPWVNSGIMILDRTLLETIPAGRFCDFGRDVFPGWLRSGLALYGWKMPEGSYLIDMGTPDKLAQANHDWALRNACSK
ncbi:MAG: nucleotidyltransferase family protein [Pseudomonadota bacterium]